MNDFAIELADSQEARNRGRTIFSIRFLLYFFSWLCLWQGWNVVGSVFQLSFITNLLPWLPFYLHEYILIITFALLIIERYLTKDFTLARSYFSAPILLIGFALMLSWTIGMYMRQEFTTVYEAHEALLIPISFFIFVNVFRDPKERGLMLIMFLFAAIMKSADSIWIKFFNASEGSGWGTLLLWRDGFILAAGIVAMFILLHYRGKKYRWLRNLMCISGPFLMYGLILSFRRTSILAIVASVLAMFFTLGRGRIKRHLWLFFAFIFGTVILILIVDPVGIVARLFGGLMMPTEEGSAYIRLMEYPNILLNIYHHPIFGVPIGIQWHQYYRMPLFANFTTLGCHNSYLYWPLRTGIIGTAAFLLLMLRTWKALLINIRIQKTEEDFLMNQLLLQCFVIYNFSCFFGLMYADAMNIMTGFLLVFVQLQIKHSSALISYKDVAFWKTFIQKKLVFKKYIIVRQSNFSASSENLSPL